jgi:ABC-2 type transport system ATP-binding protein
MLNSGEALTIRDLVVRRGGRVVLPGLSIDVPTGQVVGLLGPSGSGKSTLIRAVVGVQIIESGTVTVLGEPAGSPSLRARVGYSMQTPSIYDDLTVRSNLAYFATVVGAKPGAVDRVIDLVDLADHADILGRNLSGGQRSRVNLAAALVGEPEVLVLDEPTVDLDPVLRRSLWALFHQLADGGATLFVSSHVMDEATRCDRLMLLRDGQVLADGTLAELLAGTGTKDAEEAFLHLIDEADAAAAAAGTGSLDATARTRHTFGRTGRHE